MYSSPDRQGTFFYASKRQELWSWEDYKLYQLLLPRVVDLSGPLKCTFIRICCFKPAKVQKRRRTGIGTAQECNVSEKDWQFLHGFLRKQILHDHALWVHVSAGPSPAWTASIQFDTEGEISKIWSSQKFNGNWNLSTSPIRHLEIHTRKRCCKCP